MIEKIDCITTGTPVHNHWQARDPRTLYSLKSPFKRILDKKIRQLKKKNQR